MDIDYNVGSCVQWYVVRLLFMHLQFNCPGIVSHPHQSIILHYLKF